MEATDMADQSINTFDVWITAQGVKSKGRLKSVDNINLEGISRLRKLVIKLAIQGKLTKQEKDEEVSIKINVPGEAADLNGSSAIPKNWRRYSVQQCFDIKSGSTVNVEHEQIAGEYMYVKVSDLNLEGNEKSITTSSRYLNPNKKELNGIIPANSIIFPKRGGAIATNKKRIIRKSLFVDLNIMAITPMVGVELDYAYCWLQGLDLSTLNTGTSVPQINHKDVAPLPFPVPPLSEQHRIVAKVDELMTLCDELEKQETHHLKSHQLLVETLLGTLTQAKDAAEFQTAWSRLAQHFDDIFTTEDSIDQLKQTILQLAVMGKLVPQDPSDEPASELLKRVAKEKLKPFTASKITTDEIKIVLPYGWQFVRLGQVVDLEMGQSPDGSSYNEHGDGVPLINGPVEFGPGPFDLTIKSKFTTRPTKMCKKGDLLVCVRGATTGRTNIAGFDACIGRGVAALTPYFNKDYLKYFMLNSRYSILALGTGTTFPSISKDDILNIVFALPPLNEQRRIICKIEELFAFCDRLKERIEESQKVVNQMAESVLEQVN